MSWAAWLLPLLALVLFAPYSIDLDLSTTSYFFHNGHFSTNAFFMFMYQWGEWPGLMVGGLAGLTWVASYLSPRWLKWRKPALAISITFVLGAGILVNGVFKEFWGRPRPRQVEQFGGTVAYRPFYQPDFHHHSFGYRSFPSGHVSMGFFFLTVALIGRYERNKKIFWAGLLIAFILGPSLMVTRIAQGGHFLSDTFFAAILMWWMALAACRIAYGSDSSNSKYVT